MGERTLPVAPMTATLVLHLGPHKTATTFLQDTLIRVEPALAAEQVYYVTTGRNDIAHHDLAFALWSPERRTNLMSAGRTLPSWQDLVDEIAQAPDGARLVVSSENFAHVRDDEINGARTLRDQVDVELVVGIRRLDTLLPSLWQEGVKWGRQWPFDEAASQLLDEDRVRILPMLDRWTAAVRPRAVHAVAVPDRQDTEVLLRSFAQVIGCDADTLTDGAPSRAVNASLSWVHAEALRSVSATIDPAGDQSSLLRRQQVLHQLIPLVPPTESTTIRPVVPVALHPALDDVRREIRRGLADRGVIVHGELPAASVDAAESGRPGAEPTPADVDRALAWMLGCGADLSTDAREAVDGTRRRLEVDPRRSDHRWRGWFTRRRHPG